MHAYVRSYVHSTYLVILCMHLYFVLCLSFASFALKILFSRGFFQEHLPPLAWLCPPWKFFDSGSILNQAHAGLQLVRAWFLEITFMSPKYVCVSIPEAINN